MGYPNDSKSDGFQGLVTADLQTDLAKSLGNPTEHFRIMMDLLPIGFMAIRGGAILYANPGLLQLLGYEKAEELVGRPSLSLIASEDHSKIQSRSENIVQMRNRTNPVTELLMIRKNGETLLVEGQSTAVIHQGVPTIMVVLRDISLRKKAEDALRSSEENLKSIIQQLPMGILIDNPDHILFMNQTLVEMLGYEKEAELLGQSPLNLIHPDFHSFVQDRINRIYEKKGGPNPPLEYEWIKKDGERIEIECFSVSIRFEGKPAMLAVARDMSFRKAQLETLRNSEENFKTIIQEMPEGVMIVDRERVLFANPTLAEMLGYATAEELRGRRRLDLFHPECHSILQARVERIIGRGGVNPGLRLKLLAQGGGTVEVESSSISIQFDGKPAVLGVLRDMTRQNQLERHAGLQDKLATVGTLAAGIAHEINNPLSYVLANLVFLAENFDELKAQMERQGPASERSVKLFKEIAEEMTDTTRGSERIRDIVRGLKSFVRSNEDELVEVDLNLTVESAISLTLHEMNQKARVVRDFAPGLPCVTANPGKLQQVFINLLINAAQAIEGNDPDQNQILIRTGEGEKGVFAEFTDTGKGIPEKIRARIFETFFTTKPIGMGTGLGLSICQEIVRRYHGTLAVQSPLGKGATFTVTLPVKNAVPVEGQDSLPFAVEKLGRILVVDDEPANLEVLKRLLKNKHEVLSALTGLDALAILEREKGRVDSVVSDINMPDMDGISLYQKVTEKFPGLEKRMVFVTGGLFRQETRDFLETIPNHCLEKPFNYMELLKILSQWKGFSA